MKHLEDVAAIPTRDKDVLREVRRAIQTVVPVRQSTYTEVQLGARANPTPI